MSAGPVFFAWVDPTETTFGPGLQRFDEVILSFDVTQAEGDIPQMTVEMVNPRVGLLAPGRKFWAWLAWSDGVTVWPLFFGRVVAVPNDMFGETITVQFIAKPPDYVIRKQKLAETLKIPPFYDPVFLDIAHQDSPDAILEGYSALYHVDRITHQVTISDIIVGEDGVADFEASDTFYDALKMTVGQPPLLRVTVEADVHWTQTARGVIDLAPGAISTITGGSLISEWPKSGASLGGGWDVWYGHAFDANGVDAVQTESFTDTYQNRGKHHVRGDVMNWNLTQSGPWGKVGGGTRTYFSNSPYKLYDRSQHDLSGDPIPDKTDWSQVTKGIEIATFNVVCALSIRYIAAREHSEKVIFSVAADLQSVFVDPTYDQDSELVKLSGRDVGYPLQTVSDWSSVAGTAVTAGTVIFPDNPQYAGGQAFQVALNDGVAGIVEPAFSDIPGQTTVDGGVTWASIGENPAWTAPDWSRNSFINQGDVICPQIPSYSNYVSVQYGGAVSLDQIVQGSGGFAVCIFPGRTSGGITESNDAYIPSVGAPSGAYGATTQDNQVVWFGIGPVPDGSKFYLAMTSGETGNVIPNFTAHPVPGQVTNDNRIQWVTIYLGAVPVGGNLGNVPARSYFPSDRGQTSLQHLICRARAKLLHRSRAVRLAFDCRFEKAITLSCRMNARIVDPRLPGGSASGKIVSYKFSANGDKSEFNGHVEILCAVGNGVAITPVVGAQTVFVDGVFTEGVWVRAGAYVMHPAGDISYSVPVAQPQDDGLSFPLDYSQAVISAGFHDPTGFDPTPFIIESAVLADQDVPATPGDIVAHAIRLQALSLVASAPVPGKFFELVLRPVANGPFESDYAIQNSVLSVPKAIDLGAHGS